MVGAYIEDAHWISAINISLSSVNLVYSQSLLPFPESSPMRIQERRTLGEGEVCMVHL